MTSEERHEARYRRRKAERQRRRDARSEACGSFEQVFSYEHLYRAGRECCKGVGWKCSTQRYLGNFTANIARTHRELMDGIGKTKGFFAFDLMERGKLRHIRSVHIAERVVQRCLCDNALVPLFSAAFVYDNAASLKGKGIEVVASMVGEILTVQEAGGFQMNIAKWDDDFTRLWNTPCHTPAYSKE